MRSGFFMLRGTCPVSTARPRPLSFRTRAEPDREGARGGAGGKALIADGLAASIKDSQNPKAPKAALFALTDKLRIGFQER